MSKKPIVWSVAGSDSGGGAGIQADLLTITDLGNHACTVITCVTAQNSKMMGEVEPVSLLTLGGQLDLLAQDMKASVIKIGMLPSRGHVEILASYLALFKTHWPKPPKVILDPVMRASTGKQLADDKVLAEIKFSLLPLIDLITPNAQEIEALTHIKPDTPSNVTEAAQALIELGAHSVLVKGGHLPFYPELALDYWTDGERAILLKSTRYQTEHTHGTGCTLASAIGSALAQGYLIEDALVIAKAYLNQGLRQAVKIGEGPGPVAHGGWPLAAELFPQVMLPGSKLGKEFNLPGELAELPPFTSVDAQRLGLYPVVDTVDWLERVLKTGVKTLQLRIKDRLDVEVEEQIIAAIALGKKYQARLFINDYWQLAVKHQAYGVHLGQEDIEIADLAAINAAGLRLGLSTHGYYEMQRIKALQPSYIALGHIFPTTTKDMPSQPQGLERLAKYVALAKPFPTVAIGGIDLERAPSVLATGVGSIAVVRAVTQAPDTQAAVNAFFELTGETKAQ